MSFISDLLKEKSLWIAIGGALAVYLGTLYLNRYYPNTNTGLFNNTSGQVQQTQAGSNTGTNVSSSPTTLPKPDYILKPGVDYQAKIYTNYGTIVIDLLENYAPNGVNNFVYLIQHNFYNNVKFHRIIKNILIQTGDPTGTGTGGPGYYVKGDFGPGLPEYGPGIVGMANDGNKDHNGSQFFIVAFGATKEITKSWNGVYPVFARVISGMDVVDKIAKLSTDKNGSPKTNVYIQRVEIVEK